MPAATNRQNESQQKVNYGGKEIHLTYSKLLKNIKNNRQKLIKSEQGE